MRAVVCRAFGPPESLVVEELPSPDPAAGEVVVSVKAAGVNFVDVLIIENRYQVRPTLPFTPGTEVAGIVKRAGGNVRHLAVGDRVFGFVGDGAYAEELKAPASRFLRIPRGMEFESAAAFLVAYGTSYHALQDRAALQRGETLLVLGASGGVGIAAIEIGKALGARVIACASTPDKLAVCREHGADETIDYVTENLRERVKALTGSAGVDVVYDAVGGPYTEPALRLMAWGGRLLVVGFASGEIPKVALNLALLKGCAILGVFWGQFTERQPESFLGGVEQLGKWYQEGLLKPHVSARFPLEQAALALRMMQRRQVKGKVVLTMDAQ